MRETNLLFRITTKCKRFASRLSRRCVVAKMRSRSQVNACSIISSNCIGGLLSHDLQLRFDSPTINLFFSAEDYVKFLEGLEHYLEVPLSKVEMCPDYSYPIGDLEGIHIHFVHYKTPQECIDAWERRRRRVNMNRLAVIFTDRNGMTKELLHRYLALPYKKVVFVSKQENAITKECVYIPGFEKNGQVPEMDKFADWQGHRFYEKYFDIVQWLN